MHRDVKPQNCILSEQDSKIKLIDFGAAADLRIGAPAGWLAGRSCAARLHCAPQLLPCWRACGACRAASGSAVLHPACAL